MPEIEEELSVELTSGSLKVIGTRESDKIIINSIDLTAAQAAVLSWLVNRPSETILQLELRVKP